jgi:hypothetical protein
MTLDNALFASKKLNIGPKYGCFYNCSLIFLSSYRGPTPSLIVQRQRVAILPAPHAEYAARDLESGFLILLRAL